MNGHWLRILTAQPPTFSAFTLPRMMLLLSPKFLSHSLCQTTFPSWSELGPEQKFPKSLPLLAERWNYQPSWARQMNPMPCVRPKEAPSRDCLHTLPHVGWSCPPAISYHQTCSPALRRGWICSGIIQATSPQLTDLLLFPDSGSWLLVWMTDYWPEGTLDTTLIAALTRVIVNGYHWFCGSGTTQTTQNKKGNNWKSTVKGSLIASMGRRQVTIISLSLSLPASLGPQALASFLLSSGLSHAPLCLTAGFLPLIIVSLLSQNFDFHVPWLSLCYVANFISSLYDLSAQIPTTSDYIQSLACWLSYSTEK